MKHQAVIYIAAAVILDAAGRCLLVRKRDTAYFMQPGGKIEPGETPEAALIRELEEELSIEVGLHELEPLGQFTDVAANESGYQVVAEMFRLTRTFSVAPAAEIAEVIWYQPTAGLEVMLAPLTQKQIIPLVFS